MNITNENKKQMTEIIKNKEIKSVFQPIVSLRNGAVFAYEALSRITLKKCSFNIAEAFEIAKEMNCLWGFEKLCRINAIKAAADKPKTAKLFLNVDPDVINDPCFKKGMTIDKLEKRELDFGDIVFEVAERPSACGKDVFKETMEHYRSQGYCVAADRICSGLAGINRILEIAPHFIKIDMKIIKDLENDVSKHAFAAVLAQLSADYGIALIAVGVETEEQLEEVISLKFDYAQGYYLAKPSDKFEKIDPEIKKEIIALDGRYNKPKRSPAFLNTTVAELCSKKPSISHSSLFFEVYEIMNDPNITEMAIVDDKGKFLGVLTKRSVLKSLSGMYGYALHARENVCEVMDTSCLTVTINTSIETAAKMAMARCQPYTYDSLPVVDDTTGEYIGFVSIKDLLLSTVNIQVKKAADCNPLTGLPGNILVDEMIENHIGKEEPFSIIYFDLDNFKAYNDAYGFTNGDMMIKTVAEILTELCGPDDFCGHIGGDDFIVITKGDRTESFCKSAFEKFSADSLKLYNESDIAQGYIVSKNRNGIVENFPLATLSAAAITNREQNYKSIGELSLVIARTKKLAKQQSGNSLIIS